MSSHTAETALKLIGKLILDGDLVCETGLHIGAGKGSLEIGGADNPVVKDAYGRPYIPGSSLRGRLRSLLEQAHGLVSPAELVYLSRRRGQEVRIHQSDRPDDEICLLFGRNPGRMDRVSGDTLESSTATPARLTVYDAPLDRDSITAAMRENLDDELTEVKSENAIDRITAQANPRTLERVPAGARFRVRIVMDVLCPEDKELVPRLAEALRLLEDDTLGGGGSRGSGRVRLANLKLAWRGRSYYSAAAGETDLGSAEDVTALQATILGDGFADKLTE
jgi:CRISPR-associated protein Csm3